MFLIHLYNNITILFYIPKIHEIRRPDLKLSSIYWNKYFNNKTFHLNFFDLQQYLLCHHRFTTVRRTKYGNGDKCLTRQKPSVAVVKRQNSNSQVAKRTWVEEKKLSLLLLQSNYYTIICAVETGNNI